jgi:hypothetical protein
MDTKQNEKIYRRILDDNDVIVKWVTPGQCEEGTFVGSKPAGKNNSLLYEFTRPDGTTWKTFETCVLKQKLEQVKPDDEVRIEYLGFNEKETTKLFEVYVIEEASL